MTVTSYERGTTFRTNVYWKSGSTYVDPSSNMSLLNVRRSDGTYLKQAVSGVRDSTGIYHYMVPTESTDSLGLYICDWYAYFSYLPEFGWERKEDREVINLVYVKQT